MKIGIIGRFADDEELLDGQTIKTKILRDELIKIYSKSNVGYVDVYKYKIKFIIILIRIILLFKKSDVIIVLLSENGRKFIFPFLYYINKIFKRKVFHDVIGGMFANDLKENQRTKIYLKVFKEHWVETESMKKQLLEFNVNNVRVIPNFKPLKIISNEELYCGDKISFCTFSRVTKSKGITDAIETIVKINKERGNKVTLDIYGEVENIYEEEFYKLLEKYKEFINYKGKVHYTKSVEVIKKYYMMLFPTTFEGEGFPGTIIDAFFAGTPVIATDWKYNKEILSNNITGIIYDYKNKNAFYDSINYCIENPNKINEMRINCLNEAKKYLSENIMNQIIERIEN